MPKEDPTLAMLGQVELFGGLTKKELRQVSTLARETRFSSNETIVAQGTAGGRFFLILEGVADVTFDGRKLATLGPGDHIGEMSLIDGQPRSATVTATQPVRALSVASFNFRALLREHPPIAEKLLVALCRRLRAERSLA